MKRCPHCNKKYCEGDFVDIGIGYVQVSEDVPACDCEYIEWMENNEVKEDEF